MNKYLTLLLFLLTAAFTSCIRDEVSPCPPLALHVEVEDCNYSNAAIMDERLRPTDGPLSDYVSTLAWHVTDVATGRTVAEHDASPAPADESTATVTLPDALPFGRYAVSVWGSMPEGLASPDFADLDLDSSDPYLACDTLLYDAYHSDHTLRLRRIKSKLRIEVENLPENLHASASSKHETGLFEECDAQFHYDGEVTLGNRTRFNGSDVETATILPPSVGYNRTRVSINIYDNAGNLIPQLCPQPISTTLYRNTITALRYVYVTEKGGYDIYARVNDDWEVIHNMNIDGN